jgi:hypothetical protein
MFGQESNPKTGVLRTAEKGSLGNSKLGRLGTVLLYINDIGLIVPQLSPANSPCAPPGPQATLLDCYFRVMDTKQNLPKVPDVQFRVLIIGKANAGKTSILQRVCDTTESPEIYRSGPDGAREMVRSRS